MPIFSYIIQTGVAEDKKDIRSMTLCQHFSTNKMMFIMDF